MIKNIAYLFPGQGAQYSGMAMDFLSSDSVKSLFDTASEIFDKDVKEMLQADADTLKRTDVSQPAITVANLAAMTFLADRGFAPMACAGFSLGEYAALVCANIISVSDCLRLVKARGYAMQKTADRLREQSGDIGAAGAADTAPGMAAIIGLSPEQVESLIAKWNEEGLKDLYAANINSFKQLVVSGTSAALNEAETRFKEAGAKRAVRLPVAGPFHSPLMADALEDFIPVLEKINFNNPSIPVFSNVTGKKILSGEEAKKLAVKQITNPVRWVENESAIAACGIENCLEVGPGKVLQGLWKDLSIEIRFFAAGTVDDIEKL